ncbi:MAG TPA: hypothetical protein VHG93_18945 [Longimicrobium sp.]|nr:hypothetical protein [Longimicrobium sp.]
MRASFFSPLRNARNRSVAYVTGWAKASVRGDTIAVVFATSDTVYFYSRAGRPLGQVPVPSGYFRHGPAEGPRRTVADPAEKARWMSRFDFAEAVYWLADGTLLVAYQSVDPDRALERNRHLVRMTRSGELLFETRDGPRLLEVDGGTSTLVFVHPDAEVPDRWALGRVRR